MTKLILSGVMASVLVAGATVPISSIPVTFIQAQVTPCSAYTLPQFSTITVTQATTTQTRQVKNWDYKPASCSGNAYFALVKDQTGTGYYIDLSSTQYAALGAQGGAIDNPTSIPQTLFNLLVPQASAAIAVDSADTTNHTCSTCSSLTYAFTNTAGNVLAVMSMTADAAVAITGVTYNAVAMTSAVTLNPSSGTDMQGWYLASPTTGSNNVVVTAAGSVNQIQSGAISFSGANTSTPGGDTATHAAQTGGPGSALSASITTTHANEYLITYWEAFGTTGGSITMTGTNETATWTRLSPSRGGAFSRIPTTSTGSYTSTLQQSGANDQSYATIIWSIQEAAAAPAAKNPGAAGLVHTSIF